ncbi:CXA4 protein, partial [Columbina picui]|nr:CXA4 protein [Columbina picui]
EWGYLGKFVEEVTKHPTVIGKVWITALFIFRILILGLAGESVWGDEQSDFVCNTKQPGCDNVCYDKAFPISHIRYWVLQLIFVSTPTLIYRCYKTYLSKEKEQKQEEKKPKQEEKKLKQEENELCLKNGNVPEIEQDPAAAKKKIQEPPMSMYIVCVFCSSISEAGFLVGQWYLYGFFMVPRYVCQRDPCPHQVDCFISRPTEKSVFIIFMLVVGLISLVLNLLEL